MLCSDLPPRIYESLKILCCLAIAKRPPEAHQIAAAAALPPAQTAKILQMMTWAGFVESRRGTKGGFWLCTPPDRIRVTEVGDFFAPHNQEQMGGKHNGLLKTLEVAIAHCRRFICSRKHCVLEPQRSCGASALHLRETLRWMRI